VNASDVIIYSEKALGNGVFNNITDLVYIMPQTFDPSFTKEMAKEVELLNEKFASDHRSYILIGPGRWGSSDPWLGIPVRWAQISAARIIVESGLEKYRIDPSQGTHFFYNLTTFGVGYITINPYLNEGIFDLDYLNKQPAFYESKFFRHIRFNKPVKAEIDGRNNKAVIYKPC